LSVDNQVTKAISERIDAIRKDRGLKVVDLCQRLGIKRQTWYDHMHGQHWPDDRLEAVAEILETSPQVLRYGPEAVFTDEDRNALERITQQLLDILGSRVAVISHAKISGMVSHLYGIHCAGGSVNRSTIESLIRITLGG
jgi:transcriptional regulator with XRE-family HTH domain